MCKLCRKREWAQHFLSGTFFKREGFKRNWLLFLFYGLRWHHDAQRTPL
jgi:hypothetical protein